MARRKLLNVKSHLEHLQEVLEGIKQYGVCPAIEHELAVLAVFNKAILRKAATSRKDIRVGV